MTINEIKAKVNNCLELLEKNEKEIIQNDINERTIVHKLAEYMQKEFPDLNVDVEYNRNLEFGEGTPKYIQEIDREYVKLIRGDSLELRGHSKFYHEHVRQITTYPDIIVHERGTNYHNVLIIEVKKSNNNTDWALDEAKLKAFTTSKCNSGYGFQLGMHLIIYTEKPWRKPTYEWWIGGRKENQGIEK